MRMNSSSVPEDVGIGAQGQETEERLQGEAVAGQAAVGTQPGGLGAVAVPAAVGNAVDGFWQEHAQRYFFANEGGQVQRGVDTQAIDFKVEEFVDAFAAPKAVCHQAVG